MYFCRKTTLGMSKFVVILIGVFLLYGKQRRGGMGLSS